jgi:hypothetical protein
LDLFFYQHPLSEAAVITRKLAELLRHLHSMGIVHRDLKPENLLMVSSDPSSEVGSRAAGVARGGWRRSVERGDGPPLMGSIGACVCAFFHDAQIKLADFGLAHMHPIAQDNMLTVCGCVPRTREGRWQECDAPPPPPPPPRTWAYSAPEVKLLRKPYSHMVDCWSLGIIVYILLSGFHPFDPLGTATEDQLQENIRRGKFDFSDPVFERVSGSAKHLIQGLLQLDPRKRLDTPGVLQHPWIQKHSRLWTAPPAPSPRATSVPGVSSGGSARDLNIHSGGGNGTAGKPAADRTALSSVFPNAGAQRPHSATAQPAVGASAAGASPPPAPAAASGGIFGAGMSALAAYAARLRHRSASIEHTARASESPAASVDEPKSTPPAPAALVLSTSPSHLQLDAAAGPRSPMPLHGAGPPTPVGAAYYLGNETHRSQATSHPPPSPASARTVDATGQLVSLTSGRDDSAGVGARTDRSHPPSEEAEYAAYSAPLSSGRTFDFAEQLHHRRIASESSHASGAFVGIDTQNISDDESRVARPQSSARRSGGGIAAGVHGRPPRSPVPADEGGREWGGSQTARSAADKPPSTLQILEMIAAQSHTARDQRPASALPSSSPSILLQQQQLHHGGIDGRRGSGGRHTVTGAVPLGAGMADSSGLSSRIILPQTQPPPLPNRSAVTGYATMRHRPHDAAPMLASVVGSSHVKRAAQAKYMTMVPMSSIHASDRGLRGKKAVGGSGTGVPAAPLSPNGQSSQERMQIDVTRSAPPASLTVSRSKSMAGGLGSGPGAYAAYREEAARPQVATMRTRSDAAMLMTAAAQGSPGLGSGRHSARVASSFSPTTGMASARGKGDSDGAHLSAALPPEMIATRGRSTSGAGSIGMSAGYIAYDAASLGGGP